MLNYYKQYSRRTRIQDITNDFSGGMEYTDRPVEAGLTKILVNFDVATSGNYLKPRRGYEILKDVRLVDVDDNDLKIYEIVGHKEYNKASYVYFVIEKFIDTSLTEEAHTAYQLYKIDVNSDEPIAEKVLPDKAAELMPDALDLDFAEKEAYEVHGDVTENYKHWFFIEAFDGVYFRTRDGKYYVEKPFANTIEDEEGNAITEVAQYRCAEVEVYEPSAAEIAPSTGIAGYNALLGANMYTFSDKKATMSNSCNITPLGLVAYEEDYKTPMLYHEPGKKVYYRCYYEFGKSYTGRTKITVYMKSERENTFTKIHEVNNDYTVWETLPSVKFESRFTGENVVFKIEAMNCDLNGTSITQTTINNDTVYFSPRTIMAAVNIKELKYKSNYNLNSKTYSLDKAQGMAYWNNRIVLWDTPEDNTVLFTSEINNPSWFPYPVGVDNFEDKIIRAVPLLDTLLVFTKSKIYTLVTGPSGLGYTRSLIQSNLTISEEDAHLIIPYKNMVFFKAGNYYYMIVPNTTASGTGSLKIAPISNSIKEFFDDFKNNIENTIKAVYNVDISSEFPVTLQNVKTYIDYEDIVVDYLFKTYGKDVTGNYKPCFLNFKLLYNTVNRVWKIYLVEANSTHIKPYIQSAVDKLSFLDVVDNTILIIHTSTACRDTHALSLLPNYQLFNTGYHNVSDDQYPNVKKRFRELQLILNNTSYKALKFYTEFSIDGHLRRERVKYQCVSKTQEDGKAYLVYEAVPYMPEFYTGEVTGATILAEDKNDINAWTLDVSEFPEQIAYKIRLPFTGKGYFPSLVLVNYDQEDYELLSYVWVYRIMNAR